MQLSISLGFFGDQHPSRDYGINFFDLPDILKQSGFDAVEYFPSVSGFSTDPRYLRRMMRRAGLFFYSGHLPMVGGQLSFDRETYRTRLCYLKQWIKYFARLGIRVAVVHPDEGPFSMAEHPDRMDLCVRWAHDLARYARRFGMKIAVETTWMRGSLFAYHKNLIYFRDHIRAKNLGFCFDTGHAYGSESPDARRDPEKNFYKTWDIVKNHVVAFHLHNTYECCDYHNPFDMGGIDFRRFFRMVKEMKFDFPMTIEMNPTKPMKHNARTDTKDWSPSPCNANIERALRATAKMFHTFYDPA